MSVNLSSLALVLGVGCSAATPTTPASDTACDTSIGDISVPVFVFDPDDPTSCHVWLDVTAPAEHWCEYAASLDQGSGCAFGDVLLPYETAAGTCYLIPGDCVTDPSLTYDGSGCAAAPECTEGRPDF